MSKTTTFIIACISCGNEDSLCLLELVHVDIWMSSKRRSSILAGDRHKQVLLYTLITLVAFDGRRGFLWRIMLG